MKARFQLAWKPMFTNLWIGKLAHFIGIAFKIMARAGKKNSGKKLETDFARKDLLFLMGTIHRFPDQWLIVGIVYPPRPPQVRAEQLGLTLGQ
jgi:hypothetical protein